MDEKKEFDEKMEKLCKDCKNFEAVEKKSTFCKHCLDCAGQLSEAIYLAEHEY